MIEVLGANGWLGMGMGEAQTGVQSPRIDCRTVFAEVALYAMDG